MKRLSPCIAILFLGLLLRFLSFPQNYEVRDADELGYISDGLLLFEGQTPGYKMSPGGLTTWIGFFYSSVKSVIYLFSKDPQIAESPFKVRPFLAVEKALFEVHRDLNPLYRLTLFLNFVLCGILLWLSYQTGERVSGKPGGILLAGLVAFMPVFLELSLSARPYFYAWAFALFSFYSLYSPQPRIVLSAICFGISTACRIDMLTLAPVLLWEILCTTKEKRLSKCLAFTGLSFVVGGAVSPWFVTHLLSNIRAIASIRFLMPQVDRFSGTEILNLLSGEGLLLVALLIAFFLSVKLKTEKRGEWSGRLLFFVFLFLSLLRSTGIGIRHHGSVILVTLIYGLYAIRELKAKNSRLALILALLSLAPPLFTSVARTLYSRKSSFPDFAAEWVEKNVPTNSPVYINAGLRVPLPTASSSQRLWAEVNQPSLWQKKWSHILKKFSVGAEVKAPRILVEDNLAQDRLSARRWYLLGTHWDRTSPRYNIFPYFQSEYTGLTMEEAVSAFLKTGGALIWRGHWTDPRLGEPSQCWRARNGFATCVYVRPLGRP